MAGTYYDLSDPVATKIWEQLLDAEVRRRDPLEDWFGRRIVGAFDGLAGVNARDLGWKPRRYYALVPDYECMACGHVHGAPPLSCHNCGADGDEFVQEVLKEEVA